MTAEQKRLEEARNKKAPWKKWGLYLSERQWGTVREDSVGQATRGTTLAMTKRAPSAGAVTKISRNALS